MTTIYFPDRLRPVHPGEVLRQEFLIPMGITQREFSQMSGISRWKLGRIVCEEMAIDNVTAQRIAEAFGTSVGFWTGMQRTFDEAVHEDEERCAQRSDRSTSDSPG